MPILAASYTSLTVSYKPPTHPTICLHLSPTIPPISNKPASTSFFEAFFTVVPKALTTLSKHQHTLHRHPTLRWVIRRNQTQKGQPTLRPATTPSSFENKIKLKNGQLTLVGPGGIAHGLLHPVEYYLPCMNQINTSA
jgi:hypothetical protein